MQNSNSPGKTALALGASGGLSLALVAVLTASGASAVRPQTASPVPMRHIPSRWVHKKNPYPATTKTVRAGRHIFLHNCVACHGKSGRGNGPAGTFLHPRPKDLRSAAIQKKTDGELFWVITHGEKAMPKYRSKLSRKQRWETVDFLRTFKQGK